MDPGGMLLEDFGQRVDLTRRIREVLANYPVGTTALREVILNADDAGAARVRLCLDCRSHGAASLLAPALAQWQGPALLVFNDAVFTDEDLASISRIGDSGKVFQAWETGRFGAGFNSVYHLTDLPSIVSGKYIVMLDPQGAYLPNMSAGNPGKRIDYVSSSAITFYNDQLSPYCAFGCDMKAPFQGTLFRFPLRSVEQASLSQLSKQAYTEEDILFLFSQLYEEAVYNLLFLKNVLSLEMYVWESGVSEPKIVYSCSLGSQDDNLSFHRQALIRFSGASTQFFEQKIDSFSMDFVSEAFLANKFEKRSCTYFIVQGMASALSKIGMFATGAAKEYDLHLLPWASVAARVSKEGPEDTVLRQGRAFCFLPLPVRTGLSVHVNGYFGVSSNGRDIWYGTDMDKGSKLRSDWNMLLLEDVIAPLFRELLLALRALSITSYYSLWPTGLYVEPWSNLVDQIYAVMHTSPVLHSEIKGGIWISPAEAFLHDEGFSKSDDLSNALLLLGMPIVRLPITIADMFLKLKSMIKMVNPATVRHAIKDFENLGTLGRSHKLMLLEYCLIDLDSADVGICMNGIQLIPLADKQNGMFSEVSQKNHYYVCDDTEFELLSAVGNIIVDQSIPTILLDKLYQIASNSQANISLIDGPIFAQLFPRLFPPDWKYEDQVNWDPVLVESSPTAEWMTLFWQYIRERSYDLDLFSDWPILPSASAQLCKPSRSSRLIRPESLPYSMLEFLTKLGSRILDTKYLSEYQQLLPYVCNANAADVLRLICCADNVHELFQGIPPDMIDELHQFLLNPKWYMGMNRLSGVNIVKCKKLPIFKIYAGPSSYKFSDLSNSKKFLPPSGALVQFLNSDFIYCTSQVEEDIMAKSFGIAYMSKSMFYQKYVLNKLHQLHIELRDSIVLTILKDVPQLYFDDRRFVESLRYLPFVPSISGTLKSPHSLYDPRVEGLQTLQHDPNCFPHLKFQNEESLDTLRFLGLRYSVPETIIQIEPEIIEPNDDHTRVSAMHNGQPRAHLRGSRRLLEQSDDSTERSSSRLRATHGSTSRQRQTLDWNSMSWLSKLVYFKNQLVARATARRFQGNLMFRRLESRHATARGGWKNCSIRFILLTLMVFAFNALEVYFGYLFSKHFSEEKQKSQLTIAEIATWFVLMVVFLFGKWLLDKKYEVEFSWCAYGMQCLTHGVGIGICHEMKESRERNLRNLSIAQSIEFGIDVIGSLIVALITKSPDMDGPGS